LNFLNLRKNTDYGITHALGRAAGYPEALLNIVERNTFSTTLQSKSQLQQVFRLFKPH
jgi:hypothetical protein